MLPTKISKNKLSRGILSLDLKFLSSAERRKYQLDTFDMSKIETLGYLDC